MLPRGTFVLGGAASGKSLWAEELAIGTGKPLVYLATGLIGDTEVDARVKVHQDRRGAQWRTIEEPQFLAPVLKDLTPSDVVLIDCATMWLTNQMMAETDLIHAQSNLIDALNTCTAPWIIVSNEVGQGIVPDNKLARSFREAQGRLNIALAAQADLAVQVIAGLPQVLKGQLP